MFDFWVAILITLVVALVTVLADWATWTLLVYGRTLRRLVALVSAGPPARELRVSLERELQRFREYRSASQTWGFELASVALSMDVVALCIWVHEPTMFPFFARFDSPGTSRGLLVWIVVLGLHTLLFLSSLAMKNQHCISVAGNGVEAPQFPAREWWSANVWMLLGNVLGVLALLAAIVVFANAL